MAATSVNKVADHEREREQRNARYQVHTSVYLIFGLRVVPVVLGHRNYLADYFNLDGFKMLEATGQVRVSSCWKLDSG